MSDGCGGTLSCGSCTSPKTCGGGGVPNQCGQGCVAKTCTQLWATCGAVSDGCGVTLSCGSCTSPQTCGGAGTPNVCGALCSSACPTGYTCDAFGTCAGGNPANLVLEVPVPPRYAVAGKVTRNGVNPTAQYCDTSSYYARAEINFEHTTDSRFNSIANVAGCTNPSDAFNFSTQLYPGTYKVTVRRSSYDASYASTNLPDWPTVVVDRLLVP